ncbi:MAG: carboxypeptidase-like regulatory domain-containing protein [Fibrobacter sp.]|nr:carboxypeptidase-like regulatory domain-containing protein [Fibrobacter sp.]
MKKQLTLCGAALLALAMTGCEKTGSVEGVVMDPFINKAVEVPTVWMPNTVFGTHSKNYQKDDAKSLAIRKGEFKFDNVPFGEYDLSAKRSSYNQSSIKIKLEESNPNLKVTLYEYPKDIDAGMYKVGTETPEKISGADWVIYRLDCEDASVTGFNLEVADMSGAAKTPAAAPKKDKKSKKKGKAAPAKDAASKMLPLNAPRLMDAALNVLYVRAQSSTSPVVAAAYPVMEDKVTNHKDCKGITAGATKALFADKSKKVELKAEYRADDLYAISGTLPKGKQIIHFSQDGKTLQTYYFEVK